MRQNSVKFGTDFTRARTIFTQAFIVCLYVFPSLPKPGQKTKNTFSKKILILFRVYWDGPMSLVKLGWKKKTKNIYEKEIILLQCGQAWYKRQKLYFHLDFIYIFSHASFTKITGPAKWTPNNIFFSSWIFLILDFCDFKLDEACRKVFKRNHPEDAKKKHNTKEDLISVVSITLPMIWKKLYTFLV